jgi:hypothetical protein
MKSIFAVNLSIISKRPIGKNVHMGTLVITEDRLFYIRRK